MWCTPAKTSKRPKLVDRYQVAMIWLLYLKMRRFCVPYNCAHPGLEPLQCVVIVVTLYCEFDCWELDLGSALPSALFYESFEIAVRK